MFQVSGRRRVNCVGVKRLPEKNMRKQKGPAGCSSLRPTRPGGPRVSFGQAALRRPFEPSSSNAAAPEAR